MGNWGLLEASVRPALFTWTAALPPLQGKTYERQFPQKFAAGTAREYCSHPHSWLGEQTCVALPVASRLALLFS